MSENTHQHPSLKFLFEQKNLPDVEYNCADQWECKRTLKILIFKIQEINNIIFWYFFTPFIFNGFF